MNFIGKIPNGFNQLSQSAIVITVDGFDQATVTTSSFTVNQGITGSLFGTASYVTGSIFTNSNPALSASYALTASYALNAGITIDTGSLLTTASFNSYTSSNTSQFAGTASYATTASYALNAGGANIDTGSFVTTSSFNSFTSSYSTGSFTGSFTGSLFGTSSWAVSSSQAVSSSFATSASWAPFQISSSYSNTSTSASYALSSSYALSASYSISSSQATSASYATTASYVLQSVSSSYATSASYALSSSQALSSSYSLSSSYALNSITASSVTPLNQNVIITGSLLVGTGSTFTAPLRGFTSNLSIGMNTGSTGAVLDLRNTSGSISAGDTLGTIQFTGRTDSSYASSQIRATVTQSPGSGVGGGGNLAFWTADTGTSNPTVERMRVNPSGQVLIGVTSSLDTTSKLIVAGATNINGSLLAGTGSSITAPIYSGLTPNLAVGMNTGSTGAVLDLRNTSPSILTGHTLGTIQFSGKPGTDNIYGSSQIRATVTSNVGSGNPGGGNIAFWTAPATSGQPTAERMRVNSNGQVLIGLTSSLDTTSKLIVSGSVAISGSITGLTWTDYSTISTITGWSPFTQKTIKYMTIGKLAHVQYHISGTSNSATTTFTLPFSASTASTTGSIQNNLNISHVLTTVNPGVATIVSGSNLVTFQYFDTISTLANWGATGNKGVRGELTIEIS